MSSNLLFVLVGATLIFTQADPVQSQKSKCVLPPYPAHGTYVTNPENAKPGDSLDIVAIQVTCSPGYGEDGSKSHIFCSNGFWSEPMPQCVTQCRLNPDPSVEYTCLLPSPLEGSRPCKEQEPSGTIVSPRCRSPNYYNETPFPVMRCIDGNWDYVAKCKPECGIVTPHGESLILGGVTGLRGEMPWHAGIYTKTMKPFQQICGGSLVSNKIVISVAHCFWDHVKSTQQPVANYAVAVGKLYRPWDDNKDDAQRSDVKEIHIPENYRGAEANFENDIAVVMVKDPFEYKTYIRPLCVDFDVEFEKKQLQPGNKGKVAGWGLTGEDSTPSQVLKVVELPYVDTQACIADSSKGFQSFITDDKFCAGYRDGAAFVCKGDAGGGLAFPYADRGRLRYYLRGIVSVGDTNDHACNIYAYAGYTLISKHQSFITQFWTL